MSFLNLVLFMCTLFNFSESLQVPTLKKCHNNDDVCFRHIYETFIHQYGTSGIPELGIPPLEPLDIKNISVPISEELYFTLISGGMKGITNCNFKDTHVDLYIKRDFLEVTCNLIVEGNMSVSGTGETVKSVFGKPFLVSHGIGKLSFDKIHITSDIKFKIFKKNDGLIYWMFDTHDVNYKYDVQKVSFSGNDFLFENTDISAVIVEYFNSNWRTIVDSVGDQFLSQTMYHYYEYCSKIFSSIPTSAYIIEDLTSFL